jgi:hypothetical protein
VPANEKDFPMFVDTQNEFSDSQVVTATALSDNVINLASVTTGGGGTQISGANVRMDVSADDLWLVVNTAVAATAAGLATLTVTIETGDNTTLATNNTVLATSGIIPIATFAPAGTQVLRMQLPRALYRQYLGIRYTIATGPLTAGAFDAFLTTDPDNVRAYKSGFTVQ